MQTRQMQEPSGLFARFQKSSFKQPLPRRSLIIVAFFGLALSISARNADLSWWTVNVSEGLPTEERGVADSNPEIVVDGDTVHALWFSRVDDNAVCYRRSTDGGETWEPIFQFYQDDANLKEIASQPTDRHMAVHGNYVHIAFGAYGDGSTGWFGQFVYLRSTDGGQSFEQPRVLWTTRDSNSAPWHAYNVYLSADADRTVLSYRRQRNWTDDYPFEFSAIVLTSEDNGATFTETAAVSADNQWELCDAFSSGDQIALQYYQCSYSYGYIQFGNLFMAVSGDGGQTYHQTQISVPSANGAHKTLGAHDQHYSPVIAGANGRVYTMFLALDENDQRAVYFRRTLNDGMSFEAPINLTADTGITASLLTSQFTLTAVQDEVYALVHTSDSKLYLRKSVDGGASFGPLIPVTQGANELGSTAWWPVIRAIPGQDSEPTTLRIAIAGMAMFSSFDAGESFIVQSFGPNFSFRSADRPQMAVGPDGAVHFVSEGVWTWYSTGVFGDRDTVYYRFDPEPTQPELPGSAVQFTKVANPGDGSGIERFDSMQVPAAPGILPSGNDPFTLEFWMRQDPLVTGGDYYFVVKEGLGRGGAWESLLIGVWRSNQLDVRLTTDVAGYVLTGGPTLTPGQWFHLAVTFDPTASETNLRCYVDGVEVANATTQGGMEPAIAPFYIGGASGRRTDGTVTIDELRIWDHVRSADTLNQYKDQALGGPQPGLLAYYPMDGSPRDHSGNGHHGVFFYKETAVPGVVEGPEQPTILGSNILSGALGQSMQYQVQASFTPTAFEAEGLPEGLSIDPVLGLLSGTPTAGGVFSPVIRAIGEGGEIAEVILTISVEGASETIFNNHNIYGVQNNPTNPTLFTVAAPVLVTFLEDYHYFNNGALPGTIALRHEDGTLYGPWQTTGRVGQGNVPNAYWECAPMVTIKAGTYEVIDSDPSTWSHNSHSNYAGLTIVKGKVGGTTHRPVFDSWANNQGLSGSNADPNADPDSDGSPNWLEFGQGSNPLVANVQPSIRTVNEDGVGNISMILRTGGTGTPDDYTVNGVRYRLVAATGLGATNWVPSVGWVQNTEAEITDLGDGRNQVLLPLSGTPAPGEAWFFRWVMSHQID